MTFYEGIIYGVENTAAVIKNGARKGGEQTRVVNHDDVQNINGILHALLTGESISGPTIHKCRRALVCYFACNASFVPQGTSLRKRIHLVSHRYAILRPPSLEFVAGKGRAQSSLRFMISLG